MTEGGYTDNRVARDPAPGSLERASEGLTPESLAQMSDPGTAQGSIGPTSGNLAASTGVDVGMSVVGSDGDAVGTVKELDDSGFLVDRSLHRDSRIAYSAVSNITDGKVTLNVPAGEAGNLPRTSG